MLRIEELLSGDRQLMVGEKLLGSSLFLKDWLAFRCLGWALRLGGLAPWLERKGFGFIASLESFLFFSFCCGV